MAFFKNKKYNHRAIFFALLVLSFSIFAGCGLFSKEEQQSPPPSASPSDVIDPGSVVGPPAVSGQPTSSVEPTESVPQESPLPELPQGPDLVAKEAVGDDYFEDAAFMGNSLMDGFKLFSGLTTPDYYAATSMTVIGATDKKSITLENGSMGTLVEGLCQKPYGKIYILLGINEIGLQVESFTELYGKMLDTLIAAQPECDIYIMGITPVSYAKSSSHSSFNMERINTFNNSLHALAEAKGVYYMDLVKALAGDDGYLAADSTTDGIHFSVDVYKKWLEYVKTHYVTEPGGQVA